MENIHSCFSGVATRLDPNCYDDQLYKLKQRIVHLWLVRKGIVIDTSTPALFKTSILAAERAGDAKIIRSVSGTKPAPAETEGTPRGTQTRRVVGKAHTITVNDFDYIGNEEYWNNITPDQVANDFNMYYMLKTRTFKVEDADLSISVSDEFGDDITNDMFGIVTVSWTQDGNPVSFLANASDFNERQELFNIASLNFVNSAGSTADIAGGNVITENSGIAFEVALDTNVTGGVNAVSVIQGTLPTGVIVRVSPTVADTVLVSGSSVQQGTYKIVLKVANSHGIYTTVPLTIIITA